MADGYGQSKSMDKRLLTQGKMPTALDLTNIIEIAFNERIDKQLEGYAARDAKRTLRAVLDEKFLFLEAFMLAKDPVKLTVVKLRDDEQSPVAAPCAIEGACQYGK